jgi:curved DNA-binding protein CbpA
LKHHPDKLPKDEKEEGEAHLKKITAAKDVLTDTTQRATYDHHWRHMQSDQSTMAKPQRGPMKNPEQKPEQKP